jgi:hypothetical protein
MSARMTAALHNKKTVNSKCLECKYVSVYPTLGASLVIMVWRVLLTLFVLYYSDIGSV